MIQTASYIVVILKKTNLKYKLYGNYGLSLILLITSIEVVVLYIFTYIKKNNLNGWYNKIWSSETNKHVWVNFFSKMSTVRIT